MAAILLFHARMARALLAAFTLLSVAGGGLPAGAHDDLDLEDLPPDALKSDVDACRGFPDGTEDGDGLLARVNRTPGHQLRRAFVPDGLVSLPSSLLVPQRLGKLTGEAKEALARLAHAASVEAQVDLKVRSAYRSFVDQCVTYAYKVQLHGPEHAARYSAQPGRSQHQLGTTVDLTSKRLGYELEESRMEGSAESGWLMNEAWRFGFALAYPKGLEAVTGYAYEPWHWRYVGVEAARELFESQLPLETYLERCAASDPELRCPQCDATN